MPDKIIAAAEKVGSAIEKTSHIGKDSPITVGLLVLICVGVFYMTTLITNMQRDIHDLKRYQSGSWTLLHQQIWLEQARQNNPEITWPSVTDTADTIGKIKRY